MIIRGRRVQSVNRHLSPVQPGETIVLGLTNPERYLERLVETGFTSDLEEGEKILPSASLGPVSHYNAEGKYIVHKNKPKETAYRQVLWTWEEWRGRYDTEEVSKIVDVPYERYPRTFVPPPGVELTVVQSIEMGKIIASPEIEFSEKTEDLIRHIINLFLELFRECSVLTEELKGIIVPPVKRLNWHILPPGRYPWEKLQEIVRPIIETQPEGNQQVIRARFQAITTHEPEFVAVGQAGFRGYIIFGFPDKNLYVLESTIFGNATYVFEEDWEELSKMTKAEILDENLQKDRIIHKEGWFSRVEDLFEGE
jgi:hypothetical protein